MAWSDIGGAYESVAAEYAARFTDELESKPRDRELLTAFGANADGVIIDVGCGPGHVGGYLHRAGRSVVGLDLSSAMAAMAQAALGAAVVADMRHLPFPAESLGGIVAFYSLIHLRRAEVTDALQEFRRVLRPGHRALIAVHEGEGDVTVDEFLGRPVKVSATLFRLDELISAAIAAELDVVATVRRAPYSTEGTTTRLYLELERQTGPCP